MIIMMPAEDIALSAITSISWVKLRSLYTNTARKNAYMTAMHADSVEVMTPANTLPRMMTGYIEGGRMMLSVVGGKASSAGG